MYVGSLLLMGSAFFLCTILADEGRFLGQ